MVIQKTDQTMQAVQNENLQKSAGKRNRRAQNTQNTKKNVDGRFCIQLPAKRQVHAAADIGNQHRIDCIHTCLGKWDTDQCTGCHQIKVTAQVQLTDLFCAVSENLDQRDIERRTVDHYLHHQIHDNTEDDHGTAEQHIDHRPHHLNEDTGCFFYIFLCRCRI